MDTAQYSTPGGVELESLDLERVHIVVHSTDSLANSLRKLEDSRVEVKRAVVVVFHA